MNRIQILDCTLRDGGYCNKWTFGAENIGRIIKGLTAANIDIVECGFLTNRVEYHPSVSKFGKIEDIIPFLPKNRDGKQFVVMVNYGEYEIDQLPVCDGSGIDGIRVAFHKKDRDAAMRFCAQVKEKGYKVFVQAMVSLSYTDEEFLDLIRKANAIEPYAFYIVDSFGMMKRKNLIRLFYMVEHNLKENIWIGFHSHNNMQLAYSNAQSLTDTQTNRKLILDSSIYGMGRGAGNLNTELFVDYLNENANGSYDLKPLLVIIDEILNDFYQREPWGYSLPNYLSASHNVHPNYASYLASKNTLTVEAMDELFSMISEDKCVEFDREYIEELYLQYMEKGKVQTDHLEALKNALKGKTVLLIAPGKSVVAEQDLVLRFARRSDVVTVSVNFESPTTVSDYIFISNLRRYKQLDEDKVGKCIVTSNIAANGAYLQIKYNDLINDVEAVQDNAGLMAIKYFILLGVEKIYLAGYDGYSNEPQDNYALHNMEYFTPRATIAAMNRGMAQILSMYSKQIELYSLTEKRVLEW